MSATRSHDGSRLAESLDQLTDIAAEAGLDPVQARDEGLRVAAALAEAVPGAPTGWAQVAHPGLTDLGRINDAFFDAASRGRRWRSSPTDLLEALVASGSSLADEYAVALTEVASAAVMLGTAPIWVIANASAASGAYLAAARIVPRVPAYPGSRAGGIPALGAGALDVARPNLFGTLDPTVSQGDSLVPPGGAPGAGPGAAPGTQPGATAAEAPPAAAAPEEPTEPERSVEELLAELDEMIGLARVKKEIHRQVALLTVEKMRTEAGLKAPKMSRHLIFVGNPGTGKTTVARLVGAIYRALGLLPKGQLVEVDRSELVAGYVGQTAIKTAEVCARAVGGVLFIDEAYGLTGDQFAQEAVNTLVKEMEDHRDDLVVIVAGYPEPMVAFIAQNPGLASRFTTTIEFDDYTDDELLAILDSIAKGSDYELTDAAHERVRHIFEASPRTPAFGNGRFSRNLFEHAVGRHAWRLKDATDPTRDELRLLTADDFVDQADDEQDEPDEPEAPEALEVPQTPDTPETPGAPDATSDATAAGSPEGRGSEHPDPFRADPDVPAPRDEAVSDEQHPSSEDPA